jgi:hypothetical protein
MHETKTYRFTFDPSANRWQVTTPRQHRKLGTSKTGLKTYEVRNIPDWETRAELARKMPTPPEYEFHLDYCNRHLWQQCPHCNGRGYYETVIETLADCPKCNGTGRR